jgi:hypothetical protein
MENANLLKPPDYQPHMAGINLLSHLAILSSKTRSQPQDPNLPDVVNLYNFREGQCDTGTSPTTNTTFFKTMVLTLSIWICDDPLSLKRVVDPRCDGIKPLNFLPMLQSFLLHTISQARGGLPLPWTSAYAVFQAAVSSAVLASFQASGGCLSQERHEHCPTSDMMSVDMIHTALEHCCRTFTGLNDLLSISRLLFTSGGSDISVSSLFCTLSRLSPLSLQINTQVPRNPLFLRSF